MREVANEFVGNSKHRLSVFGFNDSNNDVMWLITLFIWVWHSIIMKCLMNQLLVLLGLCHVPRLKQQLGKFLL